MKTIYIEYYSRITKYSVSVCVHTTGKLKSLRWDPWPLVCYSPMYTNWATRSSRFKWVIFRNSVQFLRYRCAFTILNFFLVFNMHSGENRCLWCCSECIHTGQAEKFAWPRWESKLRLLVCQSNALPTELQGRWLRVRFTSKTYTAKVINSR